jgi:hypothetical protein
MAEIARFFDAASYSEADQAEVQNRFRSTGVIGGVGNTLSVGAPGGMFVSVDTGEAMVEGFWYKNTSLLNLAIANNTSGSTRVDLVVLRLDRIGNSLSAAIRQGTPGDGTPALVQVVGGIWEIAIATITIPTGTTAAITAGMIADSRTYSHAAIVAQDIADGIVGYSHLVAGAVTNLLLNYKATTDLYNGTSYGAGGAYNNIGPVHNFTVSAGCLALIVGIQLSGYTNAGGIGQSATHVLIDATTRYLLGPTHFPTTGATSLIGGVLILPGLSAGVHTLVVQHYATAAHTVAYLRAASQPGLEGLAVQILEVRK